MKKPFRTAVAAIALAAAIPTTSQATDIYLKILNIQGESLSSLHKDEIEVYSWQWGMDRPTVMTSTGLRLGAACVSELTLTKLVDKATPKLIGALMGGAALGTVRLSFTRTAGDLPVDYMTIDLAGAQVSGLSNSGGGDGPGSEALSLRFTGATLSYKPMGSKGELESPIPVTFKVGSC